MLNMETTSVILFAAVLTAVCASSPSVPTSSGHLTGLRVQMPGNRGVVMQYLGVPYAKPPTGDLRFRPPEELDESSANIQRSAKAFGPACFQPPHLKDVISPLLNRDVDESDMSEDCLFLNVYSPENTTLPLPVMVWIAGEGFDYADARHFDPSHLVLSGNVIVITVNYRVSVFGFLSGQTQDAPGNAGLWDQVAALRWVKKNVANFGGDPDNITLFGRFTGAMSVTILMTSPAVQIGLVKRAILQSGVATGQWVFDKDPLQATGMLARATGCSEGEDTIRCLRNIRPEELLTKSNSVPQRWRPVIDGHLCHEEPIEAIAHGRYPLNVDDFMLGFNQEEGSLCVTIQKYMNTSYYHKMLQDKLDNSDFDAMVAGDLQMYLQTSDRCLVNAVFNQYGGPSANEETTISLRDKYVKFCGAMLITSHMEKMAQLLAENSVVRHKAFVYQFDHRPSFSIHDSFIGAGHGDDVLFSFGLVHQLADVRPEEAELSNKMMAAFSNFARNGNPNPVSADVSSSLWRHYEEKSREILHFNTDLTSECLRPSLGERDVSFWYDTIPNLASSRNCASEPKPVSARIVQGAEHAAQASYLVETSARQARSTPSNSLLHHSTELMIVGVVCSVVLAASALLLVLRVARRKRAATSRYHQSLLISS